MIETIIIVKYYNPFQNIPIVENDSTPTYSQNKRDKNTTEP